MMTTSFLAQAAQQGGAAVSARMLFLMILVFALYVMLIRPQQRKEKERLSMIAELRAAGQRVIFAGGLIGTITEARETTFMIEVSPKVTIEVARGAVSRVLKEGEAVTQEEPR